MHVTCYSKKTMPFCFGAVRFYCVIWDISHWYMNIEKRNFFSKTSNFVFETQNLHRYFILTIVCAFKQIHVRSQVIGHFPVHKDLA